jgi:hypothetical protein
MPRLCTALRIICAALIVWIAGASPASSATRRVVLLFDERPVLPGLAVLADGFVRTLTAGSPDSIEVYRETMDLSRFGSERHNLLLRDYFRAKYADKKIDVAVAVMGPALDFLLSHGDVVFPGAPIVFCGIGIGEIGGRALPSHVTGVLLKREFAPTLELALELQRDTQRIVVVAGTSEFQGKSLSKSKYADSVVENDTRIGRIMDKIRSLGLDKNTYVFWTTDNGAWQDVYPDAGYTPFRGTKGTVREGGNRVPSIAWGPGIKAGSRSADIVGGLDYMATFASLAGVKLPEQDREGQPIIFDSYDMSPVLFGKGKSERKSWFYFTENELTPGAARVGNYKAVFNLRGDDGASTGGLAVDTNLGWKGPNSYVATCPQIFDLWQDPQERYDIFMNNYTERTWALVTINDEIKELMKTYLKYPPRKVQSETYTGPVTITQYQRFEYLREQLAKEGFNIGLPTGN